MVWDGACSILGSLRRCVVGCSGTEFPVGSGDLYAGIKASSVHRFSNVAAEVVLWANTAVIWALRPVGLTALRPEMLDNYSDQLKTIAIIAEGVPESQTRNINKAAADKNVGIIGPATVGKKGLLLD